MTQNSIDVVEGGIIESLWILILAEGKSSAYCSVAKRKRDWFHKMVSSPNVLFSSAWAATNLIPALCQRAPTFWIKLFCFSKARNLLILNNGPRCCRLTQMSNPCMPIFGRSSKHKFHSGRSARVFIISKFYFKQKWFEIMKQDDHGLVKHVTLRRSTRLKINLCDKPFLWIFSVSAHEWEPHSLVSVVSYWESFCSS